MSLFWRITSTCLGLCLFAAVLFPVFQPPLGISHRASCQSNMKQLGLALAQYAQDNDALALPRTLSPTGQSWREAIYPYVKAIGVYECPDDSHDGVSFLPTNLPKSYRASTLGPGPKGTDRGAFAGPTEKPTILTDLPDPAHTIAVTDMRGWGGADWSMTSPAFLPGTGRRLCTHISQAEASQRPPSTVNCLFADGHVKGLAPDATLTPTNLWTQDNAPFTGQDLSNAQAILARAAQE